MILCIKLQKKQIISSLKQAGHTVAMTGDGVNDIIALKDLNLIDSVLICGIVRNDEFILPEGRTTLKLDDKVIVFTVDKQITELNQILR